MARTMCGRRMILTDVQTIDENNVVQVLQKAFATHLANKIDIDYLWKYYKGRQPILDRTKDVRPEITNKVVVNRANEIVSFKVGYLMGEPVQYVSRGDDESVAQNISKLNSYMLEEDKPTKDKELRIAWCFPTKKPGLTRTLLLSRFIRSTPGSVSWCVTTISASPPSWV